MNFFEALILGILQGLTEFLPVSSSGHIELGSYLLNVNTEDNLLFAVLVHGATALSTIVIFRKDILELLKGVLKFRWNDEMKFMMLIIISMIPVGIVGVFFEDQVEQFFGGNILLVASMLVVTGTLLLITWFTPDRNGRITPVRAFIIGIAQAIAILPGISRSGSTITTALYLGVEKSRATRFSFLMVLPPILGAMLLKVKDIAETPEVVSGIPVTSLVAGFVAAFIAGVVACKWMIKIVQKGKLIYFAYYCYAVALITFIVYFI